MDKERFSKVYHKYSSHKVPKAIKDLTSIRFKETPKKAKKNVHVITADEAKKYADLDLSESTDA
jgi:hypothetical protein